MAKAVLLIILTMFISFTLTGQSKGKMQSFDSTRHFIKRIHFILKDSTGKQETISRNIKYRQETVTEWDKAKNKWEAKTVFRTSIDPFYPKEDVSKIDSLYFDSNYSIAELTLSFVFNGGERFIKANGKFLDKNLKAELHKSNTLHKSAKIYLEMTVKNQTGQEQELIIQLY